MTVGSEAAYSSISLRSAFFCTVLSSTLAGFCLLWADALVRAGWPFIPVREHWLWAVVLYAAAGALMGIATFALLWLEARWNGQRRSLLQRAGFFAVVGGLASSNVALWAFTGEAIRAARFAHFGPALAVLLVGFATGLSAWVALCGFQRAKAGAQRGPLLAAAGFGVLGFQLTRLDLTAYVALYARLHTALEVLAWAAFTTMFGLMLVMLGRSQPKFRTAFWVPASLGLVTLLTLVASAGLRTRLEGGLRHVFLEEVYVGRMLRRLQLVEAFAADPRGFRSLSWSRLARLRERYGLVDVAQDAKWRHPATQPLAEQQAQLWAMRDPLRRYNVIVYYVDTLRGDVAADRETMPNLAAFGEGAVRFRRAYSAGSDTLRSLPALTGGDYDVRSTPAHDVLRVARRAGYESTLLIPKSAQYFLSKLRPDFRFDRTVTVSDHADQQEVWGYGADQSTSGLLVDRTLDYLDEPRKRGQPFFLWLFNFDLHNWRELSATHVDAAMTRFGIEDEPTKLPFRYRAVAAALDAEFGRLTRELEQRKLLDNTLVLFVSDHGEALGRDGFWVHSVFLWEPLVHVPLLLKAPGLPAAEVNERVSLVDVAPTLARYMNGSPSLSGYAGEDLLLRLVRPPPARRLPILLQAASKDVLVRVGMLHPTRDYKLVVSLEVGLPELYQLTGSDPDAHNVADQHPQLTRRLLRDLVGSPVFPRSLWDFDVRETKEQRAAQGVPVAQ
jgi:hypothetical protein